MGRRPRRSAQHFARDLLGAGPRTQYERCIGEGLLPAYPPVHAVPGHDGQEGHRHEDENHARFEPEDGDEVVHERQGEEGEGESLPDADEEDGAAAESLHAVHVAVIEGELEYEHGDGDSRGEHAVVHVSLIARAHGESDRGRQRQQDGLDQDEDRPAAAGEWSPAHAHSNGRVIGSGPSGRADG